MNQMECIIATFVESYTEVIALADIDDSTMYASLYNIIYIKWMNPLWSKTYN